jgi:hypothetical protein
MMTHSMLMLADVNAPENIAFWWISIGLGLVVALVVVVLLSLLSSFVKDIDNAVQDVWDTGSRVAANTLNLRYLQQTATLAVVLRDEVQRHADLLSSLGR